MPQIVRRVAENAKLALLTQTKVQKSEPKHKHNFGPLPLAYRSYSQFNSVYFDMYFSLKDSDNCVKIGQDVCLIRNIICDKSEEVKVVYEMFEKVSSFFDYPLPSSHLGIYKVSDESGRLTTCGRMTYIYAHANFCQKTDDVYIRIFFLCRLSVSAGCFGAKSA